MEDQGQTACQIDGQAAGPRSQRCEPRSNLLVVATLYSDSGSSPVRLRNLSRSGALLEGAVLPQPGARVQLCRGSLRAAGQVVWSKDGRAGVRFDSTVTVADWLPKGFRAAGQQLVDEIVFHARTGLAPPPLAPQPAATLTLEQQIAAIRESVDLAADALASDPVIARSCAATIQRLDQAGQLLGSLLAGLSGGRAAG